MIKRGLKGTKFSKIEPDFSNDLNGIGWYIHMPFCLQLCPYCCFYSIQYSQDKVTPYIEAVKKETFDLILLDVVMDEMDGLDTYKKLKEIGCACPIIFMSAYYDKYEKDIRGLNPFAILRKPFDFDQLLSFIVGKK